MVLRDRKVTTAKKIAERVGGWVKAEDVMHIVKTTMRSLVRWRITPGSFGTLLWSKEQDVVELLHKEWHVLERENHRGQLIEQQLKRRVEELEAAKKDLLACAGEFNELVRAEVRRLRSPDYNGGEGQPSFDISRLDINEEMQKFNPRLLALLARATLNQAAIDREKGQTADTLSNSSTLLLHESDSYSQQQRKVRTLFALCVLIYATNPEAKHPFKCRSHGRG